MSKVLVIGGGAAGFFSALIHKEHHPDDEVIILEKTRQLLSKVRISGGGRCNVTHSCFEPKDLTKNYPRGAIELLGPFHKFQPSDTINWFEKRGVKLKTEEDGRMFPITDSSETIIQCFLKEAAKLKVSIRLESGVDKIEPGFKVTLKSGEILEAEKIILATGSNPNGHALAKSLGHTIVDPVPSLFSFNCPTSPLLELSGISLSHVKVKLGSMTTEGPMVLTHWGFSGPAILKMSAFAARYLHSLNYKTPFTIDWQPNPDNPIPKNLLKVLDPLKIHNSEYVIDGKTTYKAEFVTAGGVLLKEIHFKNMESKLSPGLYFAGEILDIDGVTGGFNFQNAWTTGFLAGRS